MQTIKDLATAIIERLDAEPEALLEKIKPHLPNEPFKSMSKLELTKQNVRYGYMAGYIEGFAGALNIGKSGLTLEDAEEALRLVSDFINSHRPAGNN